MKLLTNWILRLYAFLRSIRFAFIIIVILIFICIIGMVLPQASKEVAGDPKSYFTWLENTFSPENRYIANILFSFGLLTIFSSPFFIFINLVLSVSIICCTIQRLGHRLKANLNYSAQPETKYLQSSVELPEFPKISISDTVVHDIRYAFTKLGYSSKVTVSNLSISIALYKNKYTHFATLLVHLSIIGVIAGFAIGNIYGFRDNSLLVYQGTSSPVGHNTSISLFLDDFTVEYWSPNRPKEYTSAVIVYENSQPIHYQTISVNNPMEIRGLRFHQFYYGSAAKFNIQLPGEIKNSEKYINLIALPGHQLFGQQKIESADVTVVISYPILKTPTEQTIETISVQIDNERYTFDGMVKPPYVEHTLPTGLFKLAFSGLVNYCGFQVSYDPGFPYVISFSSIFLIGLICHFYFPYRNYFVVFNFNNRIITEVIFYETSKPNEHGTSDILKIKNSISSVLYRKTK